MSQQNIQAINLICTSFESNFNQFILLCRKKGNVEWSFLEKHIQPKQDPEKEANKFITQYTISKSNENARIFVILTDYTGSLGLTRAYTIQTEIWKNEFVHNHFEFKWFNMTYELNPKEIREEHRNIYMEFENYLYL